MDSNLRGRLRITQEQLDAINLLLLDPDSRVINDFLAVVDKYKSPFLIIHVEIEISY